MREFERIVTDYQKLNGIPHFKDTDITVSEVVKLVMDGKSNDDILAQYPALTAADIQEALAFAVRDMVENILIWRMEGLGPLVRVEGYSALLHKKSGIRPPLTAEQEALFTEIIHKESQTGIYYWDSMTTWIKFAYQHYGGVTMKRSVTSIVELIQHILERRGHSIDPEVDPKSKSLMLRENGYLEAAIESLLMAREVYTFDSLECETNLKINLSESSEINFKIEHIYHNDNPQPDSQQFLDWHSGPIGTAALILHQHGSELKIHTHEDGVTFEFDLPVWRDEAST